MGQTIRLEVPPLSAHLALVRRVVAAAAALHPRLSEPRIDDLSLAVSEACANAVDAHRSAGSPEPVQVEVDVGADTVAVTVTDHAGGFSIDELDPLPAADDPGRLRHERGLGLPLMRILAEAVSFTSTADGTAVRIEVGADPAT